MSGGEKECYATEITLMLRTIVAAPEVKEVEFFVGRPYLLHLLVWVDPWWKLGNAE